MKWISERVKFPLLVLVMVVLVASLHRPVFTASKNVPTAVHNPVPDSLPSPAGMVLVPRSANVYPAPRGAKRHAAARG